MTDLPCRRGRLHRALPELRHPDALGDLPRALRRLRLHQAVLRGCSLQLVRLLVGGIADVPAADTAELAGLAKHRPRLAHCASVAAVLVRLTELAALVLPVRRVRHGDDSDPWTTPATEGGVGAGSGPRKEGYAGRPTRSGEQKTPQASRVTGGVWPESSSTPASVVPGIRNLHHFRIDPGRPTASNARYRSRRAWPPGRARPGRMEAPSSGCVGQRAC